MRVCKVISTTLLLVLVFGTLEELGARTAADDGGTANKAPAVTPHYNIAAHRVGKIGLAVNNAGTLGKGFYNAVQTDFFTGDPIFHSCEYPRGSGAEYLFAGALWIGSTRGHDTLVSVGADGWRPGREMSPDEIPFGGMVKRSTFDPDSPLYIDAVSQEDYIGVYMDTFTDGVPADWSGRPHVPLDIQVTQTSYAWTHPWTEDFVLMNFEVENIGAEQLSQVYLGIYVDADICRDCSHTAGYADDLSGFLQTYPTQQGSCEFIDTVNIAWSADNDGDFFSPVPAPHVTGLAPLGVPADDMQYSFNWWASNGNGALDFGPRLRGTTEDPFRDFGTGGLGTPEGDHNKHYIMSHPEFDYDQAFTATIPESDPNWLYPNQAVADDFADGFDTRYLLSFGPWDIQPGQTLPVTVAYVAGENFHTSAGNIANLPDNPDAYYSNLDFSDLAHNARWADWVYDNPGVDTDGDGYFGKFRVCCSDSTPHTHPGTGEVEWEYLECDTVFYEGDGVPDFSATLSSDGQDMVWVAPKDEALWVRWNGVQAETQADLLTGQVDFEGYRVYLSPDGTPGSYTEVESYDINDYLKYVFNFDLEAWELRDYPMTLEELRCLYGEGCDDETFDPNDYIYGGPFIHPDFPDSAFHFEPFDLNKSQLGVNTLIVKRFPGQPYPSNLDPDLVDPSELTPDGYLKYFEYEMIIDNLLPDQCYWVNVTRTDYGAPQFGLPGDESDLYETELKGCPTLNPYAFDCDQGWNMVSAPLDLGAQLPSEVYGDDFPYWQLYGWNGNSYYSPTHLNGCDEYWLLAPETDRVDYEGIDCSPGLTSYCTNPHLGWNMIGSPFLNFAYLPDAEFSIAEAPGVSRSYNYAVSNGWILGQLMVWNGSGYDMDWAVNGGDAAWLAVLVEGLEICWYPEPPAPEREPMTDLFAASGDQKVTISLEGISPAIQIGVHSEATSDFDPRFDLPSPPPAPGASTGLVIVAEQEP
ncbi:MAG: hypothetical protein OEV80_17045, partial [candidate division Zixibacteria bacterium]|nr:hypothetical protein [candidate division Zixibacteria bacterium]